MKKRIVIISQVMYPSLLPRAHRTTELAKELVRQGNEVIVYALLGDYDYTAFSKETGVVVKCLGKTDWGLINSDEKTSRNFFQRIVNRTVGKYLWLPDRTMIPMVKNAIKKEGNMDCLITIAVPHVIHYAASLADLNQVGCWIADCGDPFMLNPFSKHPRYFEKYERAWCNKCNYITVPVETAIKGYYPEYADKIRIIPQGFDFSATKIAEHKKNDVPTFAYIGAVYAGKRDPKMFLEYLKESKMDFKFKIFGSSWSHFEPYQEIFKGKLKYCGRMPREQLIYELSKCDFLININNESGVQTPSKLIDYYLSTRPILSISTHLRQDEIEHFNQFIIGNYENQTIVNNIEDFNIVNVAKQFVSLF
jgi:hypothetical protein